MSFKFKDLRNSGKDYALVSEKEVNGKVYKLYRCVDAPDETLILKEKKVVKIKDSDARDHWKHDDVLENL